MTQLGNLPPVPASTGCIADLEVLVRTWLSSEVANGDPREGTVATYRLNLGYWFTWCEVNRIDPGVPTRQHVEGYQSELVAANQQASTIAVKLTAVPRFYRSARTTA